MSSPLRIVAIGCGLAAKQLHAPAIAALPGAQLVGLCDRNQDAARAVSESIPGDPAWSDDAAALIEQTRPDVVLILTPTDSHEALAIAALEAGAHVLVEKPFALTRTSADRMAETAVRCDRLLSVVHNELFTPGMDALRRRLAAGALGEISTVHYLTSGRNQRYVPDPWYFEVRGGRIGETLPHALCILDELLPELEVRSVQTAHLGKAILPDWADAKAVGVDDLRVELASPDRTRLGSIWYSLNSWVPTSVLVAGSEGNLLVHPFGDVSELRIEPPPMKTAIAALHGRIRAGFTRRMNRLRKRRAKPRIEDSSHYAQLAHFFDAVRGHTPLRADAASACRVTALWETIVDQIEHPPTQSTGLACAHLDDD